MSGVPGQLLVPKPWGLMLWTGLAVAATAPLPAQDDTRLAGLRESLERGKADQVEAARKQVLALDDARKVTFLRQGIWSGHAATAAWCANQLHHDQVDLREAARVIDVMLPEIQKDRFPDGAGEPDFDEFRQLIGSSELPKLFAHWPKNPDWISHDALVSQVHRQIRPEHIPALCRMAMGEDRRLREAVLDYLLGAVLPHTDAHRQAVGLALLHHRGITLTPEQLARQRQGHPLVLFRCLQEIDRLQVRRRTAETRNFLWRWARDERAGPADGELLLKLLANDDVHLRSIAVHGLGDFADPATHPGLAESCRALERKIATGGGREDTELLIALGGTWARRLAHIPTGDADRLRVARAGRDVLGRHADRHPLALGLLLQHQREQGRARFRALLFDGDPARRKVGLDLLREDETEQLTHGLRLWELCLSQGWFLGLHEQIPERDGAGKPITGLHLVRIVMRVPGCRRTELAVRAARQDDIRRPAEEIWRDRELRGFLAFLEVARPDELKALLRTWAAAANPKLAAAARGYQLRLGDVTAANELVAWLGPAMQDDKIEAETWHHLGRVRAPKVREFLEQAVREADGDKREHRIHGLAVWHGLPEPLGWHQDLAEASEAVRDKVAGQVLARKPVDALVTLLESLDESSGYTVVNLGLVRDPRVTRYLQKVQRARHTGRYSWATSQLAIAGHGLARDEFWAGCRQGRYRWLDNANPLARTLGGELETVPFWLEELASNCCRRNAADGVFEFLFGVDLHDDQNGLPEIVRARRFWQRYRDDLRPSALVGYRVPGPDR